MTHIKDVICPNCNAGRTLPCTQPTDTGRKPVPWFHETRVDKAKELAKIRLEDLEDLEPGAYAVLYDAAAKAQARYSIEAVEDYMPGAKAFPDTVGIVDSEQGGVIAYVHPTNAQKLVDALVNEDADPNGLDQPANLAYQVVLDDTDYSDDPVQPDRVWRTFGSRKVAIQKAIEHHAFCKGRYDVFVSVINLDFGQILGNVLSLAADPEDGRPGYFNLD